jgi:hypothetical protein
MQALLCLLVEPALELKLKTRNSKRDLLNDAVLWGRSLKSDSRGSL